MIPPVVRWYVRITYATPDGDATHHVGPLDRLLAEMVILSMADGYLLDGKQIHVKRALVARGVSAIDEAIDALRFGLGRDDLADAVAEFRVAATADAIFEALRASMSRPGFGYIDFTWHPTVRDGDPRGAEDARDLAEDIAALLLGVPGVGPTGRAI